jgi:archaetidylinositol phosphate synthase
MLSVEIYLATYAVGDFKISYYKIGPTELRILLSIGNLAVLWKSTVHLFGRAHRLLDVAGTLGISGMLLIMVISAVRNTIRLYREERVPVGKPLPNSQQTRLPVGASPRFRGERSLADLP